MARTSTRRWKGCPMCKEHKYASQGDPQRQGVRAQRYLGRRRRFSRREIPADQRY